MSSRNLEPGQFQIGDLIMGPWTRYSVESLDIGNYDVNVQDSQVQGANTTKFGQDTLKPAPLQLTINFRKNYLMENVVSLLRHPENVPALNFDDDPTLGDLQREWRAEEIMQTWGATKPLYFCGTDGVTRQFFGRPGKFAYKLHKIVGSQFYACQAEFRRLDTFAHSELEWFVVLERNVSQVITLTRGNAPSPVRFLLTGPMQHPIINFGAHQLELDWNIAAGSAVEISSYPWQTRIVDSNGLSLAAYLISENPYLDKVRFPDHTPMTISWNASGTTSASRMSLLWHDSYQVLD